MTLQSDLTRFSRRRNQFNSPRFHSSRRSRPTDFHCLLLDSNSYLSAYVEPNELNAVMKPLGGGLLATHFGGS